MNKIKKPLTNLYRLCIIKLLSLKEKGKKLMDNSKKTKKNARNNKVAGTLMMLVIFSVVYLVAIVVIGTSGVIPKIMAAPAAGFVVFTLADKFTS